MPDFKNLPEQLKYPISKTKRRLLSYTPPVLFIAIELIRSFIRPVFGQSKYGIVSNILGWLPNFIAAFAIMSLGTLLLILIDSNINKPLFQKLKLLLLITMFLITLSGLIVHEITQKGTGLYYDINDIYASIAGTLFGLVYYYFYL